MKKHEELKRRPAMIAGVSLLIMTLAAFFSYGFVHSSLVIDGDAGTTFNNIQASLPLFLMGIAGWIVILITDLLVSWAFYRVLQPIHSTYALMAGGLRLLYTFILGVAVFRLGMVSPIVQSSSVPNTDTASQAMSHINDFEAIWSFGLIIFGLHLIVVGLVALKAGFIPKWLSLLVTAAGVSYLVVHAMYNILPGYEAVTATIETLLSAPMMIGELGFGVWLLVKGTKRKSRLNQSLQGAS